MKEEYVAELDKISQVSTVLMWLMVAMMFMGIIATALGVQMIFWGDAGGNGIAIGPVRVSGDDVVGMGAGQKGLLLGALLLVMSMVMVFLYYALRLLDCFRRQQLFTDPSIHYARRIAWLFTGYIVFEFAGIYALQAMLDLNERTISLGFGPMVTLAVMWIFVWMLRVGRALQFDSEMAI